MQMQAAAAQRLEDAINVEITRLKVPHFHLTAAPHACMPG